MPTAAETNNPDIKVVLFIFYEAADAHCSESKCDAAITGFGS
jgi:hypothetical protein